jgi:serine phosphatase RsbU (regulator of sigma subunit)
MVRLLSAQFFIGSALGFIVDLLFGGDRARTTVFATATGLGIAVVVLWVLRTRHVSSIAIRSLMLAGTFGLLEALRPTGNVLAGTASASGIRFDAFAVVLSIAASSRLYMSHIRTEGARQLRAEAELALAHQMQTVLVPVVTFHDARLEVYGSSIPSDKVGGDLVDLIASGDRALAYLVDVSGHGIPAGALMGSVKTALRMAFPGQISEILNTLNRVLPSVKEPHMYATLAALRFDATGDQVEYALAGHMPILHYRAAKGAIVRLAQEQFPLGLMPGSHYVTCRAPCAPGDLFVLFSDGVVEAADKSGEDFGIDRLEGEVLATASLPLKRILEAILAASSKHGRSEDDRSILLVRLLA